MSPKVFLRVAAPVALLGLAAQLAHAGFGLGGAALHTAIDTWLTSALSVVAAVICLVGALQQPRGRLPLLLMAGALGCWATGDAIFQVLYTDGDPPVPSPADLFYAAFYPLMGVGLLMAVRSRLRNVRLWLDGVVAALSMAAVAVGVGFGPILDSAEGGSDAVAATLAYPVGDLLLLALVVAIFTMAEFRLDARAWLLGTGLVVAAVADWTFSYQVANDTYALGTALDTLWPAAMLLIAFSAWVRPSLRAPVGGRWGSFAWAAFFTLTSAGVLVVDHYHRLPSGAVWLAAAAFIVRTVRTMLAFADMSRALRAAQVTAALVESIDVAIFRTSRDGIVETWNRGAVGTFGRDADWAIDRPLTDLVAPDAVDDVRRLVAAAATADAAGLEINAGRAGDDGGEVAIRLSPLRNDDGRIAALTTIARDVTQRRQAEKADRANKAKSEFLSRMSHELRTPLNSVLGFGQLLSMRELEPEAHEEVEHILKAGDHLLELINETLEISHIESGRLSLTIEPVAPGPLIEEVVGLMAPLSAARAITVEVDEQSLAPCVAADRQRLKQVLLNLMSNAIKFNQYGGSVCVRGAELVEGRVAIAVSDTGFGIASADMPRLFSPFERLRKEDETIEGSGLGLALSRGLMEAMGGTIDAVSAPGAGSTFTLELPRAGTSAGAVRERPLADRLRAPAHTAAPGRPRTVLYIEDNHQNRELFEQIFATLDDVHLVTADDGATGLDVAFADRPDLVLLDMHLPDMHGHEVLDRLRADGRTRATPVIVVSADATPARIDAALARGAFDYVTKPVDIPRLLELLDAALLTAPAQP